MIDASLVRDVPDFPKPGIMFKDLGPVFASPTAFCGVVDRLCAILDRYCDERNLSHIDHICGIESRGFILGAAMAAVFNTGFVPIRKAGKLPPPVLSKEYSLEYGTSTLEIQQNVILKDSKVVLVDDILATGGTANAALELIKLVGGDVIMACFLGEIPQLNGRQVLKDYAVEVLWSL
jgi:adenine phosphoribosyltransferase